MLALNAIHNRDMVRHEFHACPECGTPWNMQNDYRKCRDAHDRNFSRRIVNIIIENALKLEPVEAQDVDFGV